MMVGTTEIQSGTVPQFGWLYDIIIHGREPNILFVFRIMETLHYDPILGAYEIAALADYMCVYRSSIQCHYLFNAVKHSSHVTRFIKSKYDLSVYCDYKI